jgi:bifunctional non-homologous end joining protein LigD
LAKEALTFNAFDLLFLEGFDLRDSPLSERKRMLEATGVSGPILYADHLVSDGPRLFAHACRVRRNYLEKSRCPVPVGAQRRVDQGQVRAAGEVSGCGIRQGSDGVAAR